MGFELHRVLAQIFPYYINWTVCRVKGREGRGRDLARKRGGGVFEEGLILQYTL